MVKIGLLSDTHGHIDDTMLKFLEPTNEIWHAGDLGNIWLPDHFKNKTIRAVYGNIDDHTIRNTYKNTEIFTVAQMKVIMTHIGGYPKHYAPGIKELLRNEQPQIFISGHSHILKVIYDKELSLLHINPGAAGIHGFHAVRTMVRFVIDGAQIKDLDIWEMPRR